VSLAKPLLPSFPSFPSEQPPSIQAYINRVIQLPLDSPAFEQALASYHWEYDKVRVSCGLLCSVSPSSPPLLQHTTMLLSGKPWLFCNDQNRGKIGLHQTNSPSLFLHVQGDFYHWIPLLNRFDEFFTEYIKPRQDLQLKDAARWPADPPFPVQACLQVLRVTSVLLENCSNKHVYTSYEVGVRG